VTRRKRIAELLAITDAELRNLTKNADALYEEKDILKSDGVSTRHIEDPKKALKKVQKRLAKLLSRITPPEFLFCPVRRRCYVTNAAQHRGNRVVRSLDIHKFFPSTTSKRVFWFFHKVMCCNSDIAGTLVRLATYRGHLPTGSPLSPIMSYFAHTDMWDKIADLCREAGVTMTVYMDDVTVSGEHVPDSLIWQIKQVIHGSGHRYHKEKAFYDSPAEVTGVFIVGNTIKVPHRQFKKLRIALNAAKAVGFRQTQKAQQKLDGLKGQVAQIRKVAATLT
jgi:retron-type reverse transcriptase